MEKEGKIEKDEEGVGKDMCLRYIYFRIRSMVGTSGLFCAPICEKIV